MDTTTILPTPPTSGAIVHSGYHNGYNNNNNFFDTWAAIEATNRSANNILSSICDSSMHQINAINTSSNVINKNIGDAAVSAINASNLNGVSTTKAVTDGSSLNLKAISDLQTNLSLANAEERIEAQQNVNTLSNLINSNFLTSFGNQKDIILNVSKEACHTREKSQEQYAAIQLEACRNKDILERELLKGFANTQLEAAKNFAALQLEMTKDKCELQKQISDCCCELKEMEKETQALILKQTFDATKDDLMQARLKILALENKIPVATVAA